MQVSGLIDKFHCFLSAEHSIHFSLFLLSTGTAKDSIFIRPSQSDQLYKIRDSIKFHLFINTAPCGDARIFSPHETEIGVDKHPNRYKLN